MSVAKSSHRCSSEPYEGHLALYPVACQRDGLEDVAQRGVDVHLGVQELQVLWLLQGLGERGTLSWEHLHLHTQSLGRGGWRGEEDGGETWTEREQSRQGCHYGVMRWVTGALSATHRDILLEKGMP